MALNGMQWGYLEEEDDVPDESQDDGGVSVSDVGCIDADELHLRTHVRGVSHPAGGGRVLGGLWQYSRFSPPGKTAPWQCC